MSFDLCVLASKEESKQEVMKLYERLCDGDVPDAEPSAALEEFIRELSRVFPELGTLDEDEIEDSPWSSDHDRSNLHLMVCIQWGRQNEVAPLILKLAKRLNLTVFDPQSGDVYTAR